MNNIENIQEYIPTVYVNDSEPDLDETNLNKTEQAIKRVTDAANKAIDALKQLDREKLALSAISNVLSDATDKVPSLALANTMQLAINDLNSNLGMKITSGNMTEIIGALPVGKYAGYYSSGSFGAPSHYGTFEAVVMNSSTATITAIDTSNKVSYLNVKTSDVWCGWQSSSYGIYLSDRDLNTVKLPGTYIQTANASATTTLHYPVAGAAGFLEVIGLNNNDWLLQRYTGWGTANQTYKRVLYQGSWRDWMAE